MIDNSCELYRNYTEDDIAHIVRSYHPVGTYRLLCEIFGTSYTIESCVAFLKRFTINDSKRLDNALELLTSRERQILEHRFGLYDSRAFYDTMQSIGGSYRLTRKRIRQIEAKLFTNCDTLRGDTNLRLCCPNRPARMKMQF
jgi:hypothetical protein